MLKAVTETTGYTGQITGLYGDVLQGWALHTEQPGVRLAVEVYIDGAYVALARADQMQHEFDEGDGFHGFSIPLRKSWLQNATVISVRIANHGPWLDGTLQLPESKAKDPGPGPSQVWYSGGLKVTGWACHATDTNRHVTVVAREGSNIIAQAVANQPHPALVNQESADHGFSLDLPWELGDGKTHTVHVEDDEGKPLSGSPITVFFHPEGLETLLRRQWPGKADDPALELLIEVARDQDRRAPRTVGFAHYAKWFEVFQRPGPLLSEIPCLKAGILLYGDGSEQDEAVSRASIQAQRWPAHAIVKAEPNRLPQAAHQLLIQGAEAIVPLHVGDRLAAHALDTLLPLLAGEDAAVWVYADNDCDGPNGERTAPWLKPAWDIDLFLGTDIVTPGSAYSAELVRMAFRLPTHPPAGGIHDFAAAIAAAVYSHKLTVIHVPHVLYHQRHGAPVSPADSPANLERHDAMHWLANIMAPGAQVSVNPRYSGLLHIEWPLPEDLPRVSLIVPTRDQYKLLHTCIEGLLTKTDYTDLEIIVVDNDSTDPKTLAYLGTLQQRGITVLRHPHPFNYSAINNRAVEHATGNIIGLVNNDIAISDAGWLKEMLAQLLKPGVAVVGAKLTWPNDMVQHGGVAIGINSLASHTGAGLHKHDPGYLGLNQLVRSQSAVTAACLLIRKTTYQLIGKLDEVRFPVAFNDVDLCLRARSAGERIVWTPFAELIHAESASRGKEDTPSKAGRSRREQYHFIHEWAGGKLTDPYYHPCLNHDFANGPYGGITLCPRSQAPRLSGKPK